MQDRSRYGNDARKPRRKRGFFVAVVLTAVTGLVSATLIASSAASAPAPRCSAKPDATNTGASGQLKVSKVRSLSKRNSKLTDARLKGTLVVSGDGSVVRNVSVNGPVIVTGDDVTVDHVTAKSVIASGTSHLRVSNSNLSGGDTAVYITSDRGAAHGVNRVRLVGNYIHDPAQEKLGSYSGTHVRGAIGVTISCSNYALAGNTKAAIYVESASGGTSDVVVSNNWLDGGQFTVNTDARLTLEKNVFGTSAWLGVCQTAGQPISQSRNQMSDGSRVRPCPRGHRSSDPTPTPEPTPTTSAAASTSTDPSSTTAPTPALTSSPPTTTTSSPTQTATTSQAPNPSPSLDSTEAAVVNRWGAVVAGDEFNYTGAPDNLKWHVYDSAGHAGNGVRRPAAWNVDGSVARVTGDSSGTTGGMSAKFDRRKYGRWEARMRTSARDSEYHPVLLLWPDSGDWPCDGEVDYAEGVGDTSRMNFFLHHGCNNQQISARQAIDTTQWHNYAVDWQPDGIT
jgi:hypothetical protein